MAKFQVHAAADKPLFQHRPTPGRAGDGHLNRLRTVLRMAGNQHRAVAQQHRGVAVVLGLNLQHRLRGKVLKEHPSFNLRPDDIVIHLVAEVGMWSK